MNYRDTYPSCAECPFLRVQQTQRDSASKDIQDSELLIVAKQAMLDHYIDMSTNINTYTLLQLMSAREHGMPDEQIKPLLDGVDEYNQHVLQATRESEENIATTLAYIEASTNILNLTDKIAQKVADDCPGYHTIRYLGQEGCKSALIPFVDNQNK